MLLLGIIRRVLLPLVPLVLFYLLKKGAKKDSKKKFSLSDFDPSAELIASKSQIVEGEIVEEKK